MSTKICSKCNKELLITNFSKLSRSLDGLAYHCKECTKIYNRNFQQRTNFNERYHVQYYQKNKTKLLSASAQWKKNNPDKRKQADKEWAKINKDRIIAKNKKWYELNKEYIADKGKQYRGINKEHRTLINRKWLQNNRKHRTEYIKIPQNHIAHNLRSRLYDAIKNKQKVGSAIKDLGCSIAKLKIYLQLKFSRNPRGKHEYMTWDNYGEWHIDHIKPLSSFDLTNPVEFIVANKFTNLQPMWAKDNLKKGDTLNE